MIKEVQAKSILRKYKKIDSWFIARYGMNLYRGCPHNCAYCDGRSESYFVDGEFGKDIEVKVNAPELLDRELNPARKRKPMKPGFAVLGGGVGDSYCLLEKDYSLARKSLEIIEKYNFPPHLLTKSVLIERDLDILSRIKEKSQVLLSFSFSGVDDSIGKIFEPGVPLPSARLSLIQKLKNKGYSVGVFLMPVIPYITDTKEQLELSFKTFSDIGVDYIVFGGMTLKSGRQEDHFYKVINEHFPKLLEYYKKIYKGDKWGSVSHLYYNLVNKRVLDLSKKYNIPLRIPARLFNLAIDKTDLVTVILEQMDYLLKQKGEKTPYAYGAYSVSQLSDPIEEYRNKLTSLKGIGPVTEKIILEILETGTSRYYERLISNSF